MSGWTDDGLAAETIRLDVFSENILLQHFDWRIFSSLRRALAKCYKNTPVCART